MQAQRPQNLLAGWILLTIVCGGAIIAQHPSSAASRVTFFTAGLSVEQVCADANGDYDGCVRCDANGCGIVAFYQTGTGAAVPMFGGTQDAFGSVYSSCSWDSNSGYPAPACAASQTSKPPCGNGHAPLDASVGVLEPPGTFGTFRTLFVIHGTCENILNPWYGIVENVAVTSAIRVLSVDVSTGRMDLAILNNWNVTGTNPNYPERIVVSGLPTLFDVLVTYTPTTEVLVGAAARPEGHLSPLDAQDVLTGNVRDLPDFSKATRVCGVIPAPDAGQGATIADPLPAPGSRQASYFLVASRSGADTRMGRSASGGQYQGRPVAGLPLCQ